MARVSRRKLASYIASELADTRSNTDKLAMHVAAYLVDNKMVKQADLLMQDISDVMSREHGVVLADVITAHPLNDSLRTAIRSYVTKSEGARSVELNESIDESLIGGVVIRTPGAEFDSSISSQLKTLRSIKTTRSN